MSICQDCWKEIDLHTGRCDCSIPIAKEKARAAKVVRLPAEQPPECPHGARITQACYRCQDEPQEGASSGETSPAGGATPPGAPSCDSAELASLRKAVADCAAEWGHAQNLLDMVDELRKELAETADKLLDVIDERDELRAKLAAAEKCSANVACEKAFAEQGQRLRDALERAKAFEARVKQLEERVDDMRHYAIERGERD